MVKRVTLTKLPKGAFSKSIDIWYADLLFEVKFHFVSEHLPDDSDKFASTVSKGIVVSPAFSSLGIIVSFESSIVFNNIVSCIYEGIA
ncbi:MAG: hypothetical protein ACLVHS_17945 [Blautia wexlerae]